MQAVSKIGMFLVCLLCLGMLPLGAQTGRFTPQLPIGKFTLEPIKSQLGDDVTSMDPLLDPNTWSSFPSAGTVTGLFLQSVGFVLRGDITLRAVCCFDPRTQYWITNVGTADVSPSAFTLGAGGTASASLRVSVSPHASPGRYLVRVSASNANGNPTLTKDVLLTVVPVPAQDWDGRPNVPTSCPSINNSFSPTPEALAVGGVLEGFYISKRRDPGHPASFVIGAANREHTNGWVITIEKPVGINPPILPTEAFVVLSNASTTPGPWDKTMRTLSSATSCPPPLVPASQSVTVGKGESAGIRISTADTTALLLSEFTCAVRGFAGECWGNGGQADVAVFSEPNFWLLFGGRKITIKWLGQPVFGFGEGVEGEIITPH